MNGDADAILPASSFSRSERLDAADARSARRTSSASGASTIVGRRRQRRAAQRLQREEHLIVLEIGRLQPGFDAVGERHDGDAELGNLAARRDGGRPRACSPSASASRRCRSRR